MGSVPIPPDYTSLNRRISSLERELELLRARRIPASSLPNELLASPVVPAVGDEVQVVTFTASPTDYATVSLVVPDGFTQALVVGLSSAYVDKSSAGATASARIATSIEGVPGNEMVSVLTGLDSGNLSAASTSVLTGLVAGNEIDIATNAYYGALSGGTLEGKLVTTVAAWFLR
jgi:hypothetical protein